MTLRRVHVARDRIREGRARIGAEALHYLRDVLRLAPGTEIELFDGAGGLYRAKFAGVEALEVGERSEAPAPGAQVWIAFALSKREKPDLVIQNATELGASRFLPWQGERSVVRLEGERASERTARWRRIAAEAARQCGRADVPKVDPPATLAAILAAAPARFERLLLDAGGEPLGGPRSGGTLAVVGPEGGMTTAELDTCAAAGCRIVSMGPRVLRAETAAIAAAALLQYLCGDLSAR